MMRRKIRRGISLFLSLGMLCSLSAGTGSGMTDAAAVGLDASGAASVDKATAGTGGSDGSVYEDEETGFRYKLCDDAADEDGKASVQKVEIVGYADDGTAPLAEGDADTGTELVIPGTLDGNEVTGIGNEAFKGNQKITAVTIAEGITTIGYSAFENCTNLQAVSIPSTITEWSEVDYNNNAFMGCTKLKELELAEGLTVLGQCAFYGCKALEKVRIPSSIETFQNKVFYECTSLKEVELPEGIKQIGYQAFAYCALEEVTIPSTIEMWSGIRSGGIAFEVHDNGAFYHCESLRKIVFTEGLKTLENFQGINDCPLIKEIEIPGSVQKLGYAFQNAKYLERVTLNEGTESIGVSAFAKCASLKEIRIPSTVSSVEYSCFLNSSLERMIFSPIGMPEASLALTSSGAPLKQIYILSDSVQTFHEIRFTERRMLYCPQDSRTYKTYQSAVAGSDDETRLAAIPPAEVSAAGYVVEYDGQEHDIAVLNGVQDGDRVFYRLNGEPRLRTEMPKVKEAGSYPVDIYLERCDEDGLICAYSAYKVMAKVTKAVTPTPTPDGDATPTPIPTASPTPIPAASPTPIPTASPTPKPPTQNIAVGSAVTAGSVRYKVTGVKAGKLAVAVSAPKSRKAKSVSVPAAVRVKGATYQVTSIAANAFKNCKKLKSVTIGKNVTSIGKNAFSNAKALKKITVKSTKLRSVGKGALKGIHKKAVIKVPKAKLKKYKKLFKGKGQKKSVKIKK